MIIAKGDAFSCKGVLRVSPIESEGRKRGERVVSCFVVSPGGVVVVGTLTRAIYESVDRRYAWRTDVISVRGIKNPGFYKFWWCIRIFFKNADKCSYWHEEFTTFTRAPSERKFRTTSSRGQFPKFMPGHNDAKALFVLCAFDNSLYAFITFFDVI